MASIYRRLKARCLGFYIFLMHNPLQKIRFLKIKYVHVRPFSNFDSQQTISVCKRHHVCYLWNQILLFNLTQYINLKKKPTKMMDGYRVLMFLKWHLVRYTHVSISWLNSYARISIFETRHCMNDCTCKEKMLHDDTTYVWSLLHSVH